MRFSVEYADLKEKSSQRRSITLLNTFLNHHLLGKFHGWSYECIFVKFIQNAPKRKVFKVRRIYNQGGEVELSVAFSELEDSVEEFTYGFEKILQAVEAIDRLPVKGAKDLGLIELHRDLTNLRQFLPKSIPDFEALYIQRSQVDSEFQLRRVNGHIQACRENPRPHTRRLVGIRIYEHFDPAELLPHRYMYGEIFSTLLRNANIATPGYREIYFSIDKTLEKAKAYLAAESWQKYTYCALDIEKYRHSGDSEKEELLLNALFEGLRLIADFDHLDKEKIEKVIEVVSITKTKTALTYAVKENGNYKVKIEYWIGPDHTAKTPYYITITNKVSNKELVKLIDNFDTWWVPHSIRKIRILKDKVVISGGGGLRGEVTRSADHLPDQYVFDLAEINA